MCLKTDNELMQVAAANLVLAAEQLLQALQDPESDHSEEISNVHSAIGLVLASPIDKLAYFKRIIAASDRDAVKRTNPKKKRKPTDVEIFDEARKLAKRGGVTVRARWLTPEGSKFDAWRHGNCILTRSDPKEFLAAVRKLVKSKGSS